MNNCQILTMCVCVQVFMCMWWCHMLNLMLQPLYLLLTVTLMVAEDCSLWLPTATQTNCPSCSAVTASSSSLPDNCPSTSLTVCLPGAGEPPNNQEMLTAVPMITVHPSDKDWPSSAWTCSMSAFTCTRGTGEGGEESEERGVRGRRWEGKEMRGEGEGEGKERRGGGEEGEGGWRDEG